MGNLIGYVLGVILHGVQKYADFKREKSEGWYLTAKLWDNLGSAVIAVVCFGLWDAGWIALALEAVVRGVYNGLGGASELPRLPINVYTSLLAGYVMDSAGRRAVGMVERRFNGGGDAAK
jgi:hypothetical protein